MNSDQLIEAVKKQPYMLERILHELWLQGRDMAAYELIKKISDAPSEADRRKVLASIAFRVGETCGYLVPLGDKDEHILLFADRMSEIISKVAYHLPFETPVSNLPKAVCIVIDLTHRFILERLREIRSSENLWGPAGRTGGST